MMSPRAAVWEGPERGFSVLDVAEPELAPGEALVAIELSTICGSDIHTVVGDRDAPIPTVLGHEAVARVVATTASTQTVDGRAVQVGDRVTWTIGTSCGSCRACVRGFPQKCAVQRKYGHEAVTRDWFLNGDFATHCHLLAGTGIVRVPETLPAKLAAPANCATATVVAAARRAGLRAGDDVAVLGCGMLGLTAIALARETGARQIVACDVDESRRTLATLFGADIVVHPDQFPIAVGMSGADTVFELSGDDRAVKAAIEAVAVGGTVALVGSVSPSGAVSFEPDRLVKRLVRIIGSHNYSSVDLESAIAFLAASPRAGLLADLVSDPFPLDDIGVAFEAARSGLRPRVAVSPEA